jgi:hypothetical protein
MQVIGHLHAQATLDFLILKIFYCSILLHFPLSQDQFSVLRANTCVIEWKVQQDATI